MSASTLHSAVLDALGSDIVSGELPAGSVLTLESLQQRYSVSRGVARECMRILESLRMVTSQRRTGICISPEQQWNVYDTRMIRWRLDSKHRAAQLRSLTELRLGIEPIAAHLATLRATPDQRTALGAAAEDMRRYGTTHRPMRYLAADIEFHRIILAASGNEMYTALADPIAEVLRGVADPRPLRLPRAGDDRVPRGRHGGHLHGRP